MQTIAIQARSFNTITVRHTNRTAGYDSVDVQVSTRKDFKFVPSPIYPALVPDGSGDVVITGQNQANLYFVRSRERNAAGDVLPWTEPKAARTPLLAAPDTTPMSIMVRPAIIVPPAPATWSASDEVAGYPASNLESDAPGEQFWGGLIPGGHLLAELSGEPWDTVALLGTTLNRNATWRIRTADTAADTTAAPTYDTGIIDFHASPNVPGRPSYHGLHRTPTPRSDLFVRIDFSATGDAFPPGSRVVMTYGVIGLARTAKNIAADKTEAPLDYGSIERLRDGTPDRRYGVRGRRVEFEIALMTEAQWETQFSDLRHKVGLTESVLVVPNTRDGAFLHDRILFGPLQAMRNVQPHSPRFTQSFTIESLI